MEMFDAAVTGVFLFIFLLFGMFSDDYDMMLRNVCAVAGMNDDSPASGRRCSGKEKRNAD